MGVSQMESNMLKPNEICNAAVGAGCSKAALKTYQQAVLGILAGAFIACGGVVSAVASHSITNVGVAKFVG